MLYTTNTVTSKEELNRFNNALFFSRKIIILIALYEIFLLVGYLLSKDNFYIICAIVFIPALYGVMKLMMYSKYKKEAAFLNVESTINFYEDSIEQINKYNTLKIPYTDLYKLLETKTNYYFLIGTNSGLNVIKKNCSQELLDYIDNDLKKIIKK